MWCHYSYRSPSLTHVNHRKLILLADSVLQPINDLHDVLLKHGMVKVDVWMVEDARNFHVFKGTISEIYG